MVPDVQLREGAALEGKICVSADVQYYIEPLMSPRPVKDLRRRQVATDEDEGAALARFGGRQSEVFAAVCV